MTFRNSAAIVIIAVLAAPGALMARQNIVANGSMEAGPGQGGLNWRVPEHWERFGENVERSEEANMTSNGNWSLKAFGDSVNPSTGGRQVRLASPGDSVSVSGWLYTRSTDKLSGTGQAGIRLEFLGFFGQTLDSAEVFVVNADTNGDIWIPAAVGPLTAPVDTVEVRVTCVLKYTVGLVTGSVYWDDVVLTGASSGPILNGDFEAAGVSTEPNPDGIDYWTGFEDQRKSEEEAFHGNASVKIGTSEPYSGLYQNMGVLEDGDHVYLLARTMITSNGLLGNARIGIKLEFDPVGEVAPPEETLPFDEDTSSNAWHQVTLSTTVPAEMTVAKIVCIYTGTSDTTGSVYFDWVEAKLDGGGNQLLNYSFENEFNPNNWTTFFSTGTSLAERACLVGFPAYHGNCMLKTTGTDVAGAGQEISVTPGQTLDISAWLYTPSSDDLVGTGRAGVKVEWAPGNVPNDVDIGGPTNTLDAGDTPNIWHELYIDYTMPAGSFAIARFTNLVEKGTATGGAAYFDGCEAVVLNKFVGADVDGDDDEDLVDFAWFQYCFGSSPLGWPCLVYDLEPVSGDDDVDLDDYTEFEAGYTGP